MNAQELIDRTKEHFQAVKAKDLDSILATYAQSEDLLVFVEGPRWLTRGYAAVKRGWTDFVASPIDMIGCEWTEPLTVSVAGSMGFVAGIVDLNLVINGEPKDVRFRGSFVFEKDESGEWKVVFEHFSQPAADPYGIGDWLKPA